MDDYNVQNPTTSDWDKFALGKKWFWVGLVLGLNLFAGLVFGIALVLEKDRRKEGLIILGFTVVWALVGFFWLGPWLLKLGILPKLRAIR